MNKCQQEFEKWAKQHALHLELISDEGSYWKDNTALVYGAWCAAWEAAQNLPGAYTEGCSQEDKLRMMRELQVSANKGIKNAIK